MRRILSAALSLLLVAGLAGCNWRPAAATVNGAEITTADLQEDLTLMRESPELAAAFQLSIPPEGEPVPSGVTANLLTLLIAEAILAQSYRNSDKKLAADQEQQQRAKVLEDLTAALGSEALVAKLPPAFVARLTDRFIHSNALLSDVPQEDFAATVTELFGGFEVTVDPRYGTWNSANFEVVPDAPPAVGGISSELLVRQ